MIKCVCCGVAWNCALTVVKDAREDVDDLWMCDCCFHMFFNDEFWLFREDWSVNVDQQKKKLEQSNLNRFFGGDLN